MNVLPRVEIGATEKRCAYLPTHTARHELHLPLRRLHMPCMSSPPHPFHARHCLQSVYTCMPCSLFVRKRAHTGYRVVRRKAPRTPTCSKLRVMRHRHCHARHTWWIRRVGTSLTPNIEIHGGLEVVPKNHRGWAFLRTFSNCISEPVRVAIVAVLACP